MTLDQLLRAAKAGCNPPAKDLAALAKCLRVTRQAVSSWDRGESFPDWRVCRRIAKVSGVALADVLLTVSAARAAADSALLADKA